MSRKLIRAAFCVWAPFAAASMWQVEWGEGGISPSLAYITLGLTICMIALVGWEELRRRLRDREKNH